MDGACQAPGAYGGDRRGARARRRVRALGPKRRLRRPDRGGRARGAGAFARPAGGIRRPASDRQRHAPQARSARIQDSRPALGDGVRTSAHRCALRLRIRALPRRRDRSAVAEGTQEQPDAGVHLLHPDHRPRLRAGVRDQPRRHSDAQLRALCESRTPGVAAGADRDRRDPAVRSKRCVHPRHPGREARLDRRGRDQSLRPWRRHRRAGAELSPPRVHHHGQRALQARRPRRPARGPRQDRSSCG